MEAATVWAAVGALGTLAATGVAAVAAFQSRNSARDANAAAGSLAAIERGRRHDELAPEFSLALTETGGDHANLKVTLAGGGMANVDEAIFTILDETGKDHWSGGLPGRLTQDEAQAFVWGPWEFNTAAAVQIASNRESWPKPYSRMSGKNWELLPLKRTQPGYWMTTYSQQQWQEEYQDQPVRLLITCRREGYERWTLLHEVYAEQASPEARRQASQIRIRRRAYDGAQAGVLPGDASKPVHMLVVTNTSSLPVRNLAAQIDVRGSISPGTKLADATGKMQQVPIASGAADEIFVRAARSGRTELLDAGDNASFAWSFDVETYPDVAFTIRFADDHELQWEVGPDLRPKKAPVRDW